MDTFTKSFGLCLFILSATASALMQKSLYKHHRHHRSSSSLSMSSSSTTSSTSPLSSSSSIKYKSALLELVQPYNAKTKMSQLLHNDNIILNALERCLAQSRPRAFFRKTASAMRAFCLPEQVPARHASAAADAAGALPWPSPSG